MNILQKKVSLYAQYSATTNEVVTLGEFLFNDGMRQRVEEVRRTTDEGTRKKMKSQLPCATISGIFNGSHAAKNLIEHSGLICIDIDQKENPHINDWEYLKEQISTIKYVAFAGLSVSGKGVFVIIPIPPCKAETHAKYYASLETAFAKCGVVTDQNCKDVCRLRGASYDPHAYFNPNAELFTKLPPKPQPKPTARTVCNFTSKPRDTIGKVEWCVGQIVQKHIDLTTNYDDWYKLGFALASLGEQGRQLYHSVSQFYNGYNERETDAKFTHLLRSHNGAIGIGSFFEVCKRWGIATSTKAQTPSPTPSSTTRPAAKPPSQNATPPPPATTTTASTPPPTPSTAKEVLTDDDIYMMNSDPTWPFTCKELREVWT